MLGNRPSPDFFHRLDPTAGAHGVAFAPFHVEAQACTSNHAGKRMMAGATGLLRVVASGSLLLFAVARDHGGIPVSDGIGRYGMMDDLLGGSKPGFHLGGLEIATKPAEGVLSTEPTFEYTGDFGYSLVFLQSATMGEPDEELVAAAQMKLPVRW